MLPVLSILILGAFLLFLQQGVRVPTHIILVYIKNIVDYLLMATLGSNRATCGRGGVKPS